MGGTWVPQPFWLKILLLVARVLGGMPATARPCAHFEVAGCTVLVAVAGGDAETVAPVEEAVVHAMVGFGEAVRAAALGTDAPEPAAEEAGQDPVAEPPPAVDAMRTAASESSFSMAQRLFFDISILPTKTFPPHTPVKPRSR